jgi:hypothetical protein
MRWDESKEAISRKGTDQSGGQGHFGPNLDGTCSHDEATFSKLSETALLSGLRASKPYNLKLRCSEPCFSVSHKAVNQAFLRPQIDFSKDIQVPGLRISRRGCKDLRQRLRGLTETLRRLSENYRIG